MPQHIVQRGIDHRPCFACEADYLEFREVLTDVARHCGCAIHAYVLMPDHVHLLVTATERGAVSRMMQQLGRRYVAAFNGRHQRAGALWASRFKTSLIDSQRYLFTCHRYIELNQVRAALVADPAEYRWSSHWHNAFGKHDRLVTPHALYQQLGERPSTRQAAYRTLFAQALSEQELTDIRIHAQQQKALGTFRFQTEVEALLARNVTVRPRGRPRLEDYV